MSAANLSFSNLSAAQGAINGQFLPWVIQWQLPTDSQNGFVIQRIQVAFQNVHYCGVNQILSDDDIWNLFDYQGDTRLDYWEAWQWKDGLWQPPGSKDSWGFSKTGTFYSNDTEGAIVFSGNAGFYEGEDLEAFGDGWGQDGDNEGSPMSGDLMSTTRAPNLPTVSLIVRTMSAEWHPCGCDSDDSNCRKTTVTIGPSTPEVA